MGPLERRVCEVLIDHNGPTCVIGFNPYSHAWFAEHHPKILRGLDSYSYRRRRRPSPRAGVAQVIRRLEHVQIAKPHFLALGLDMLPAPAADASANGHAVIAWTVRSPEMGAFSPTATI